MTSSLCFYLIIFSMLMPSRTAASPEDQACANPDAPVKVMSRKALVNGSISTYDEDEEPDFYVPRYLEPGQLAPIVWRDNGKQVDPEGYFIGLPPELTKEIQTYLTESGVMELARMLLYKDPVEPGENRLYPVKDGSNWGAMGPKQWKSGDLTWIDAADEAAYEITLDLLRVGNFDVVLDAVGKFFELQGLMVQGVGVIAVSHFSGANMHYDIGDTGHKFFNIIFPVHIPTTSPAQLMVGSRGKNRRSAPANLRSNVGILLGGQTQHGTGKCDYRDAGEFRIGMAVYLADLTDDNIEDIAGDTTSLFPNEDDLPWFRAQAGRVWGNGNSLKNDKGRKPYNVQDDPSVDCADLVDQCTKDLMGIRMKCLKTCKVYLEDNEYYLHLKKLMSEE